MKQEHIRGKVMSHCTAASRKWIYNFLLLEATQARMKDFKQGRENSARETGKLSRSLTVCNKTQARNFNADSQLPLEANWSWIQIRNNTLRKMASQSQRYSSIPTITYYISNFFWDIIFRNESCTFPSDSDNCQRTQAFPSLRSVIF